jgi:hypothetical protein
LHFRVGDPDSLASTIKRAVGTPGLWEELRDGISPVHRMDEHIDVLTGAYESLIEQRARELVA